jgi:hypothetical protein
VAWKDNVVVIANLTVDSGELLAALAERTARRPASFLLVVPPSTGSAPARRAAEGRLRRALDLARQRGLEIDGRVGVCNPLVAAVDAFDPRRFDEIIVCTLPAGVSRWLQGNLPHAIRRATGAPVQHVVAAPPRPSVTTNPAPRRCGHGVLAPLVPLGWGPAPDYL